MSSQMNQDQWVKYIAEEVLKRLRQRLLEKHVVVMGHSEVKSSDLLQAVKALESEGYICDDYACDAICNEALKIEYGEGLLVDGFSIGEAQQLIRLDIQSTRLKVIYEALRQGKLVYVVAEDFNLAKNSKLQSVVAPIQRALEEMGVKILGKKAPQKVMAQKVITAELIEQMDSQVLFIREDAVLTYGAREYLKTHQIRIERK